MAHPTVEELALYQNQLGHPFRPDNDISDARQDHRPRVSTTHHRILLGREDA